MAVETISAVAKTKFYVGGVTSGQELADYEAATFIEVTDLADIGEFGDAAEIIPFKSIGEGRTKKVVGSRDAGDLEVTVGRIELDPGQQAMRAASKTSSHYDFKVVLSNGETFYFTGPVTSAKNQLGGADDIMQTVFTVALSSTVLEVASA